MKTTKSETTESDFPTGRGENVKPKCKAHKETTMRKKRRFTRRAGKSGSRHRPRD